MSVFNRSEEHRSIEEYQTQEEEVVGNLCRFVSDRPVSPSSHMEQEKRIRREIANSNERRRMQSINAGFQSLRTLLPHHEGEKLSKAAILQQTAEYIYQLEQEKTSLLSQNCQLKRLINQHEGQHEAASTKKRKIDTTVAPTVSESSDEGIGSMSPEPIAIITSSSTTIAVDADHSRDIIELRIQLDRERKRRMQLEDQVRNLESQLYPEKIREITQQLQFQYQHQPPELEQKPIISRSCGLVAVPLQVVQEQETAAAVAQLQVVSAASLPPVAQTTTISASPSPPLKVDSSHASLDSSSPKPVRRDSTHSPTTVVIPSPPPASAGVSVVVTEQRLPSVLEAAIKAEPKVEVERLPSPATPNDDVTPQARLYLASTSRQNLETIVEAIRHLEGDHLFSDDPSPRLNQRHLEQPAQEVPLALTTHHKADTDLQQQHQLAQRLLKVEMDPFLQFHSIPQSSAQRSALQQQRPGVIVVKQHT